MKFAHSSGNPESSKDKSRMPGDLGRIEAFRTSLMSARAEKLGEGRVFGVNGDRTVTVERGMGALAFTLIVDKQHGLVRRTDVEMTWSDIEGSSDKLPCVRAERTDYTLLANNERRTLETLTYDASRDPSRMGLDSIK